MFTKNQFVLPFFIIFVGVCGIIAWIFADPNLKDSLDSFELYNVIIPILFSIIIISTIITIRIYQKEKEKTKEFTSLKEKNEKLTTIGLMASRLAHDIRNPLSIIKNASELMIQEHTDSKSQARFEMMNRAISRIAYQIDEVMDFVQSKPLNLAENNIISIVNKTVSLIQIPQGLAVNVKPANVKIRCDSRQLEVVFNNIIINAIEALRGKGTIVIQVEETFGNMVHISIEDSGNGVEPSMIDKIFEPLFTTKISGTGLGLVTCKNIIERHGGKIVVSNNPSKFTIILSKNGPNQ